MNFFKNFLYMLSLVIIFVPAIIAMEDLSDEDFEAEFKFLPIDEIDELEQELNKLQEEDASLQARIEAGNTELQRMYDQQGVQDFSYQRHPIYSISEE